MAKKQIKPIQDIQTEVEKVYSNKYQCFLTKRDAYFDEVLNDWLNVKIEVELKDNPKFNR